MGQLSFQSIYEPAGGVLLSLPLMPEWYFLLALLGGPLLALGLTWSPLLWVVVPVYSLAAAATLIQAGFSAAKHRLEPQPLKRRVALRASIVWLHLIQPLARLIGRIRHGVAPWQWANWLAQPALLGRKHDIWSEEWQPIEKRLADIEEILLRKRQAVMKGR